MVVMANNLDEYGAIDDKLQEILDLAAEKEIPVLFELSKRVLGKSLGKKIKVSVAAIQATDGAHQQFVKLSSLAPKLEKPSSFVPTEASSPET
jgi:selenocysteine insertion sequence-binding protein 2